MDIIHTLTCSILKAINRVKSANYLIIEHQDLTIEMHESFDGVRVIRQEILKAHKDDP